MSLKAIFPAFMKHQEMKKMKGIKLDGTKIIAVIFLIINNNILNEIIKRNILSIFLK